MPLSPDSLRRIIELLPPSLYFLHGEYRRHRDAGIPVEELVIRETVASFCHDYPGDVTSDEGLAALAQFLHSRAPWLTDEKIMHYRKLPPESGLSPGGLRKLIEMLPCPPRLLLHDEYQSARDAGVPDEELMIRDLVAGHCSDYEGDFTSDEFLASLARLLHSGAPWLTDEKIAHFHILPPDDNPFTRRRREAEEQVREWQDENLPSDQEFIEIFGRAPSRKDDRYLKMALKTKGPQETQDYLALGASTESLIESIESLIEVYKAVERSDRECLADLLRNEAVHNANSDWAADKITKEEWERRIDWLTDPANEQSIVARPTPTTAVSGNVRPIKAQARRRDALRSAPGCISTGGIRYLAAADTVHETLDNAPCIIRSDGSRSEGRVVRAGEGIQGLTLGDVNFIRIDHQACLQVGEVEIVIESPFKLRVEGSEYALDPGERGGLGPLLALWPDELTTASTGSDGTLHLTFGGGATVTVPPDPHYEAWQIVGPGTALIVCMPGTEGQLAVWT